MTSYHCQLSVRWALWFRNFNGFLNKDGKPASEQEAFDFLCDHLKQGHEIIPMGECDNFDWEHGCQGHAKDHDERRDP